tara:strand:- start:4 stop:108 length:105 start_codon:yes stop_codon:yes gene_type:complete
LVIEILGALNIGKSAKLEIVVVAQKNAPEKLAHR